MSLFTPLKVGAIELQNRIVMAPLTRIRAAENNIPTDLMVEYYKQRASAGSLLITEATFINQQTVASSHIPGIFTDEQQAGWKKIADAVHEKGGFLSMQLWHQGRLAHESYSTATEPTCFSSSAVQAPGKVLDINEQWVDHSVPKPLTIEQLQDLLEDYVAAGKRALAAGIDLLEIHSAHGYLLDQFLCDSVNKRDDIYGGPIENRIRFPVEVATRLVKEFGSDRIAIRLSALQKTSSGFFGVTDSDPDALYAALFKELEPLNLAYLLCTEERWNFAYSGKPLDDPMLKSPCVNLQKYKPVYKNTIFGAGGFTPETARAMMELDVKYDGVGFGRWYISNPDLVERIRLGLPLNDYNRSTFYINEGWNAADKVEGYTDYPTFKECCEAAGVDYEAAINDKELVDKVVEFSKNGGLKYELFTQDFIGASSSASERKAKN